MTIYTGQDANSKSNLDMYNKGEDQMYFIHVELLDVKSKFRVYAILHESKFSELKDRKYSVLN